MASLDLRHLLCNQCITILLPDYLRCFMSVQGTQKAFNYKQ